MAVNRRMAFFQFKYVKHYVTGVDGGLTSSQSFLDQTWTAAFKFLEKTIYYYKKYKINNLKVLNDECPQAT